jgi:hypothetical protein
MFLVVVGRVELTRPVLHGETLTLEVRSKYVHRHGATMDGEAKVDGELIARADRIVFAHDLVSDPKKIQAARERVAYQSGAPSSVWLT